MYLGRIKQRTTHKQTVNGAPDYIPPGYVICPECQGEGQYLCPYEGYDCPFCGTGGTGWHLCAECGGTGLVPSSYEEIKALRRIRNGQQRYWDGREERGTTGKEHNIRPVPPALGPAAFGLSNLERLPHLRRSRRTVGAKMSPEEYQQLKRHLETHKEHYGPSRAEIIYKGSFLIPEHLMEDLEPKQLIDNVFNYYGVIYPETLSIAKRSKLQKYKQSAYLVIAALTLFQATLPYVSDFADEYDAHLLERANKEINAIIQTYINDPELFYLGAAGFLEYPAFEESRLCGMIDWYADFDSGDYPEDYESYRSTWLSMLDYYLCTFCSGFLEGGLKSVRDINHYFGEVRYLQFNRFVKTQDGSDAIEYTYEQDEPVYHEHMEEPPASWWDPRYQVVSAVYRNYPNDYRYFVESWLRKLMSWLVAVDSMTLLEEQEDVTVLVEDLFYDAENQILDRDIAEYYGIEELGDAPELASSILDELGSIIRAFNQAVDIFKYEEAAKEASRRSPNECIAEFGDAVAFNGWLEVDGYGNQIGERTKITEDCINVKNKRVLIRVPINIDYIIDESLWFMRPPDTELEPEEYLEPEFIRLVKIVCNLLARKIFTSGLSGQIVVSVAGYTTEFDYR